MAHDKEFRDLFGGNVHGFKVLGIPHVPPEFEDLGKPMGMQFIPVLDTGKELPPIILEDSDAALLMVMLCGVLVRTVVRAKMPGYLEGGGRAREN